MLYASQRRGLLLWFVAMMAAIAACAPANERPASGAVPGARTASPIAGLPPTLEPSEALRLRALPSPSPGLDTAASPSPAASPGIVTSPSPVAAPPIVRTINPAANGRVPAGAVNLSAVLVGRGADLASTSLTVDGADAGAQIDKPSSRQWTIHASQSLANGTHTARVLVRDGDGGAGGFTWQFSVGESDAAAPNVEPAPAASPAPKPRSP